MFYFYRHEIELLNDDNPTTRAVACFDMGEFSRVVPLARKIIEKFEVKKRIMMLLDGDDPVVKENALVSLQKIMMASFKGGIAA